MEFCSNMRGGMGMPKCLQYYLGGRVANCPAVFPIFHFGISFETQQALGTSYNRSPLWPSKMFWPFLGLGISVLKQFVCKISLSCQGRWLKGRKIAPDKLKTCQKGFCPPSFFHAWHQEQEVARMPVKAGSVKIHYLHFEILNTMLSTRKPY